MPDNLLDSIDVIDEGIHAMNVRLANMLPVEGFHDLQRKRNEALERLDFLTKLFIGNSTKRFISADSQLVAVNAEMKQTLAELEDMQQVLDTATRFVAAIDTFIGAVVQIV